MRKPDFARTDLGGMSANDLRFLVENMPQPGGSYEEIAQVIEALPSTLESMLTSDFVYDLIRNRQTLLLGISPFLLFSVLLRRSLGKPRSALDRRVVNYLANLLALFVSSDRLHRVESGDSEPLRYVVQLLEEAETGDARRRFAVYAHIGNYALWLSGLQQPWLEHRYRYGRRPVSPDYYAEQGQSAFEQAARHDLARRYGLDDVFLRLAMLFDHYRSGLMHMRRHHMS